MTHWFKRCNWGSF